jgi:uncharacterized membrane protein
MVRTRLRAKPSRLLRAALGALLLAGLSVAIYPRLIEDGAASGVVSLAQVFGIAATALTFLLFVAAVIPSPRTSGRTTPEVVAWPRSL